MTFRVIGWGSSVLVLVCAVVMFAQAPRDADITGYYNEKDGEYTRISRNGDLYHYLDHQKTGDWVGVAIRENDRLAIAWQRSDRANLGVSYFHIENGATGPTLIGGWAAVQDPRVSPQRLTWSRRLQ